MPWDGLFALDAPIDFLSMHAVHYYDYLSLHAQLIANNVGKHACMHLEQPFFIFLLFFSLSWPVKILHFSPPLVGLHERLLHRLLKKPYQTPPCKTARAQKPLEAAPGFLLRGRSKKKWLSPAHPSPQTQKDAWALILSPKLQTFCHWAAVRSNAGVRRGSLGLGAVGAGRNAATWRGAELARGRG